MSSDCANDEASKWLLDGGCSNHMTVKKNIFIDMEIIGNSYVRLGNCSLVEVKGRETVVIQTKKESKVASRCLVCT